MIKISKFTSAILLSLIFVTASARDWVEESNEYTTVVLNAQVKFQPEAGTRLGLSQYDELIRDLEPDLFERMVTVRNRAWLPRIEGLLNGDETAMVVVGALHLVGPGGLIEMLRDQGYRVEQL